MLLLTAWAEANPSGFGVPLHGPPRIGPPRRWREGNYDEGFDELSSDDTDDDDSDGDSDDDEDGQPARLAAAAIAAAAVPRGDWEGRLAAAAVPRGDWEGQLAAAAGPIIPGLASHNEEHLAHYVRVSHLSLSYLHCIVPHTPWFTVRGSGGEDAICCCTISMSLIR